MGSFHPSWRTATTFFAGKEWVQASEPLRGEGRAAKIMRFLLFLIFFYHSVGLGDGNGTQFGGVLSPPPEVLLDTQRVAKMHFHFHRYPPAEGFAHKLKKNSTFSVMRLRNDSHLFSLDELPDNWCKQLTFSSDLEGKLYQDPL